MAATVVIKEWNGSGPTATTVTHVKHQSADRYDNDTTYPIVKPSSSSNYGYTKSLVPSASGSFTSLSNWKWYSDAGNGFGTGVTLQAKVLAQGSYAQASGTQGTTGTVMSGGSDAFGYSAGSPLSLTGTITASGSGSVQLVQLQMVVATTASAGTTASETLTWRWDEV